MTEWIISSTVLMLIVIGLRAALKGHVGLKLQYALWLLVLVRLLVPVNLTQSALSVIGAAEQAMAAPAMQTVTEFAEIRPEVRPYAQARAEVTSQYEAFGISVDSLSKQELREFEREVQARRAADYTLGDVAARILKTVWIIGMAVTALCLLGANRRFGRELLYSRRELPVPGCELPVYVTGAVETPCLFGLPKPAVYLPAGTPWDETAMEHILTHEGTHFRHGDHIWSVLRCVCLAVHWYNPLVWVCAELSRRDGELACDEASIRALGEERRAEYGRTLIDMSCQGARGMVGLTATTMNYSARSLKERIRLIARHPKTAACTLVLVILVAALAVGCTFTGTPEETTQPTEPPTTPVTEEVTEEPTQPPTEPEHPTGPETTLPAEPVDARLQEYQALFDWQGDMIFNRAAGHEYAYKMDVDLYYLFYNGVDYPGSWDSIDASERDLLIQAGFWPELDIQIMPAELLEEKLLRYFGLGLAGVRIPDGWVYSADTDTYYSNHNDAYANVVTVAGYSDQPDGNVLLHLIVDGAHQGDEYYSDAPMYMTLTPVEGGYRIVSNVFAYGNAATWVAPADIRVHPFTDAELAEAVSTVEKLWEEFGYSYRIEHISFDPITTDHWVRENYATDRGDGMSLEEYYETGICMVVSYSYPPYIDGEIEFLLIRGGAGDPWVYAHHCGPGSYYPGLLLDPDGWNTLGYTEPNTVAVYRANDGENHFWVYTRDPQSGQIGYMGK